MSSLAGVSSLSWAVGKAYHPLSEGSAIVWLDSSQVTESGTVSQVTDQSGNARHATQSTETNKPTYTASDSNFKNHPSIAHDGVDNFLTTSTFGPEAQPFTMYGCLRQTSLGSLFFLDDTDGTSRVAIFDNNANGGTLFAGGSFSGGSVWTVNTVVVYGMVVNGASSAIYLNDPVTAAATGNASTNGLKSLRIGSNVSSASWFPGQWTAFGAFAGAHSETVRARVMGYLNNRYRV